VANPYAMPGTVGSKQELCLYCYENRDRDEVLTKHTAVIVCSDSNLIGEDDYNHYYSSYTVADMWYCEYCEEMKDSDDVYEKDTSIWCCPSCHNQYDEKYDAANCCG